MALLLFKCVDCQTTDERIGAPFETTAICHECGGLMLRLDEDIFAPFFREGERLTKTLGHFKTSQSRAELRLAGKAVEEPC